jgi:molybdopterin-guanine dinucleotide biosynthesis protein A
MKIRPRSSIAFCNKKIPGKNWLVIACDYPFLTEESLTRFLGIIKEDTITASFYSPDKKVYEPLLAFYSKESVEPMKLFFDGGNYSLNDFLKMMHAKKHVADKEEIKNINTPEEMKAAKLLLKSK